MMIAYFSLARPNESLELIKHVSTKQTGGQASNLIILFPRTARLTFETQKLIIISIQSETSVFI